jgi:hypothetical protein
MDFIYTGKDTPPKAVSSENPPQLTSDWLITTLPIATFLETVLVLTKNGLLILLRPAEVGETTYSALELTATIESRRRAINLCEIIIIV